MLVLKLKLFDLLNQILSCINTFWMNLNVKHYSNVNNWSWKTSYIRVKLSLNSVILKNFIQPLPVTIAFQGVSQQQIFPLRYLNRSVTWKQRFFIHNFPFFCLQPCPLSYPVNKVHFYISYGTWLHIVIKFHNMYSPLR